MMAKAKEPETYLKSIALQYPEAVEDHPWGHDAIKVRGKAFVFFSGAAREKPGFSLSVKLPVSSEMAVTLPFAEPTGYGLGKHGWVSADFGPDDDPPLETLEAWIDQSYRAIAPKKLSKTLPPSPHQ